MGLGTPDLVTALRDHLPDHGVSRADVAEDYTFPGAWDCIVSTALKLADELGIQVHHEGDWHRGEKGRTIKLIGTEARKEIAEAAEAKVHLFLFVKVREDWADDPERYREMGLEFPRDPKTARAGKPAKSKKG